MSGDLQRGEPEATTGLREANPVTAGEADSAGRVVRILILEDEALGADLAQRLLVRAALSFTALVVGTRASFIEQLAAFRPEIILSDYRLPGFSGHEAFKIAQEDYPDIPFIFWSGVLGDEAAVELNQAGRHRLRPEGPAREAAQRHPARAGRG
jgi:CheY-like chemotaxis protein